MANFTRYTFSWNLKKKQGQYLFDHFWRAASEYSSIALMNHRFFSISHFSSLETMYRSSRLQQSRCSFVIFHRKTPALESLFNKVGSLQRSFSCEYCKIFKNSFGMYWKKFVYLRTSYLQALPKKPLK